MISSTAPRGSTSLMPWARRVWFSIPAAEGPTLASPMAVFSSGTTPIGWNSPSAHPTAMEHVCGRPLGLALHNKTGHLYIADAYLGLLVVGPEGGVVSPLVTQVEGHTLRFTNDLVIDHHKNTIYFTDSSKHFYRREFPSAALSVDRTGQLMKYDISSKDVFVLLRGLSLANGVALSKDGSFLLVVETTACRVVRLWIEGPNAGKREIFAELPGHPDNIRMNGEGEFWVALHSKTALFQKLITSYKWLGTAVLKLQATALHVGRRRSG